MNRNSFLIAFVIFTLLFIDISFVNSQTAEEKDFNCFSILIGNKATADGSVMFAHNEDDWGERLVNWFHVPGGRNSNPDSVRLKNGGYLQSTEETWDYLWLEMPGLEFSDSYMNEWGVTIASDACVSREDNPELTNGGIGYWLRRAMAERARTAKEAVKIGGSLVDQFGYSSSGRTYCIADPNEAWMLSVVNGKHWVAQRIPDGHVAIIPNYYTITTVNLTDTSNFLGSADIFDYAIEKGWFNAETPGSFSFREVYSDQGNLESLGNKARHWTTLNALSVKQYYIDEGFPFSFTPKKAIELADIFDVLRDHYEGTDLDKTNNYESGHPHEQGAMSVCSSTNQYGFVAQLRNDMPVEIGAVLWLSPRRPCTQPFIPWYLGIDKLPDSYSINDAETALETHFEPNKNIPKHAPGHHFLNYSTFAKKTDKDYEGLISDIQSKIKTLETELLENQAAFEVEAVEAYKESPQKSKTLITDYTLEQIEKAEVLMR